MAPPSSPVCLLSLPPLPHLSPFSMPPFFFLGSGGGACMFLFPSFHLLPFLQSKPSPLASLWTCPPVWVWKGSSQGNCRRLQRHSLHHQLCIRRLAEVFGDLSVCVLPNLSPGTASSSPGHLGLRILTGLGCLREAGDWKGDG